MSGTILVGNDFDWWIKGFFNNRTKQFMNTATGTWTLRTAPDGGGTLVSNGSMDYVAGSNGDYVGGIDDAIALTVGTTYYLTIILAQDGVKGDWRESFVAQRRTGKTPFN